MKLSELRKNISSKTKESGAGIDQKTQHLDLILDLLKKINSSLVLDDVLRSVLKYSIKLTNSERGFIVLENENKELKYRLGLDYEDRELPEHFFNISTTVVEDVFLSGRSRFIEGAQSDVDNHPSKSILRLALQTIFCSPLIADDKKIGVIYVDSKSLNNVNIKEVTAMFEILASQAAIAIRNAKLHEELKKAKIKAEESDKLKSAFLSQISHEVRTPLNTIFNYNSILKEMFYDKVEDEYKFLFSSMQSAGERIIRTLDNVVNMSLLDSGEFTVSKTSVNLEALLTKLIKEFETYAKSKNLEIKFEKKVKHCIVLADEYTITILFQNLIDNAIKFTDSGFVSITIKKNRLSQLTVEVEDTGKGISKEYLDDLFEAFSQEEIGYTRRYEGAGLGLSIVNEFAKLNDCKVKVKSKVGKGSKFTVIFEKKLT